MRKKDQDAHKALVKDSKSKKNTTRERLAAHIAIQKSKLTTKRPN